MNRIIIVFLSFILVNCSSGNNLSTDKNGELIGRWRLTAQLTDPGDGSGVFSAVKSDKVLEFFSDGEVKVNGSMCYMTTNTNSEQTGTFELVSDSSNDANHDGIIKPDTCEFGSRNIYFDFPLDGGLILWYTCIEACGEKYEKL
ncbi:hypothetical protein [Cognatitamlana onchidii]|uniref:hypothetical protein n=1 Tax=Cognatitamlana onchidii TaxID=2562860 RepID=UPI0010A5F15C|nr:hypothetical protein [Algibacter onchidii]